MDVELGTFIKNKLKCIYTLNWITQSQIYTFSNPRVAIQSKLLSNYSVYVQLYILEQLQSTI